MTIASFLAAPLDGRGNQVALRYFDAGRWKAVERGDLARSVRELAAGLDDLGVALGGRVAVLAPASPATLVADLAVQTIGAEVVAIDPGLRSLPLARLLRRSEPGQIFVCDLAQLDRVLEIRPDLPSLDLVLLLGAPGKGDEVAAAMHVDHVRARGALRLQADPQLLDELSGRLTPETPALLLPSETTGEGSDFAATHQTLVASSQSLGVRVPIGPDDVVLAALPAHRASYRAVRMLALARGAEFVFARGEEGTFGLDLVETQPTILLAEGRRIEDLAQRARESIGARGVPLRRLYDWGFRLGEQRVLPGPVSDRPPGRSWRLWIADASLIGPFRRKWLGGRLRRILCPGPPLPDATRRFLASLGVAAFDCEDA